MTATFIEYLKDNFNPDEHELFNEELSTTCLFFETKKFHGQIFVQYSCDFGQEMGGEVDEMLRTKDNKIISVQSATIQTPDTERRLKIKELIKIEHILNSKL